IWLDRYMFELLQVGMVLKIEQKDNAEGCVVEELNSVMIQSQSLKSIENFQGCYKISFGWKDFYIGKEKKYM
ncbi:hypothetical protein HAX54_038117, partial [Datura stramonium]|nr:hypothetical protein [Datura stramonium]